MSRDEPEMERDEPRLAAITAAESPPGTAALPAKAQPPGPREHTQKAEASPGGGETVLARGALRGGHAW